MEGEGENFHYESLENNPINSQLTAKKHSCFRAKDNKSYQILLNNVTNNLSPLPNGFSGFSTVDGATSNDIDGLAVLDGDKSQDHENVNSSSYCDVQSNTSSDGGERTRKSSACTYWVKGQWTTEEDRKLVKLVKQYGLRKWAVIAENMVGRIGKQCRERWQNHLRPDIKKSVVWTDEEERLIIEAHKKFGNRWTEIAKCVPGRSENAIKNHWNATRRKQTSKRKIRRPERLRGLIQSTVLEEYIKKKYFNKVSITSNNPKTNNNNNNPQQQPILSDDIYDDSTTYFTLETFDEEMNFMKDLFADKDNPKQIINNASNYDSRNISSSSNFSASAQTIHVESSRENVGNSLLAFSLENNNMARVDIPREAAQETYYAPEIYFYSYVLHGLFGNQG